MKDPKPRASAGVDLETQWKGMKQIKAPCRLAVISIKLRRKWILLGLTCVCVQDTCLMGGSGGNVVILTWVLVCRYLFYYI